MLLLIELANDAADRIYRAIIASRPEEKKLQPILQPFDPVGSTRYVDFETIRSTYKTRPDKCHVSHVVADTNIWEQKMAQALEDMEEVVRYVKNHNLNFTIPYTLNDETRNYLPDFIVGIHDGRDDPLNLIVEVTGQKKKDKAAKVTTAKTLWVPAVNNHGSFGRWAFLEITDPWDAQAAIRAFLAERRAGERDRIPAEVDSVDDANALSTLDLIRKTPNVLGGSARIGNRRIAVWMLVELRRQGATDEEIRTRYAPPLSQADLDAAWRYYSTHREEIDRDVRENEEV